MLTKKQPAAGEWWQYNKNYHCRVFILGANCSGHMVGVDRNGEYDVFDGRGNMALEFWHHEPLCDSFDWQPAAPIDPGEGWDLLPKGTVLQDGDQVHTDGKWMRTCCVGSEVGDLSKGAACTYRRRKPMEQWPKYYICGTWDHAAYVRKDDDGRITTIYRDGSECRWDVETKLTAVLPDGWRSVTKAGALARVKTSGTRRHERDVTYVCDYCYAQGHRGHMQK
jgi:hypothetical protein